MNIKMTEDGRFPKTEYISASKEIEKIASVLSSILIKYQILNKISFKYFPKSKKKVAYTFMSDVTFKRMKLERSC